MPLAPKVKFSETLTQATVRIEIQGVHRGLRDVFLSEQYIKLNAPPYFFEADLYDSVEDGTESFATTDDKSVTFNLKKKNNVIWGQLASEQEMECRLLRRRESIERAHTRFGEQTHARKLKKTGFDKVALERQMMLENQKRVKIEARREREIQSELRRISSRTERATRQSLWQAEVVATKFSETDSEDESEDCGAVCPSKSSSCVSKRVEQSKSQQETSDTTNYCAPGAITIQQSVASGTSRRRESMHIETVQTGDLQPAPPLRAQISHPVKFTQLEQDYMPAREQREAEIKHWKKENKLGLDAGRQHGGESLTDTSNISERQPIFLKDKADKLLSSGNITSALELYTKAIEVELLSPHPDMLLTKLFSNRSVCFSKLCQFTDVQADVTQALDLMIEHNTCASGCWSRELEKQRFKLLLRRAHALTQQKKWTAALSDFESAHQIRPNDACVVANMQDLLACTKPLDCKALKGLGDTRFRAGNIYGAAAAYSSALQLQDVSEVLKLTCLLNIVTCAKRRGDYGCIVDLCNIAFRTILYTKKPSGTFEKRLDGPYLLKSIQNNFSECFEYAEFLIKLFAWRGKAHCFLTQYTEASTDYIAAAQLCHRVGKESEAERYESLCAQLRHL
mmetsp:Transcript_11623/g.40432  ORF Transcript_11623/g.40432 Transcript_11623/m.40432 type:complete len:625 (+) Transcript_11623:74-1948(+)|eukprot:CAMPEP_0183792994 /NCGR_PEP_ID=MMETSP0803_2-20130417/2932_1 /TAXON_ID=195967 /ORGANISM="Crustomastix stigmata, Strain CCMP3273" /LENGTH=624 /DNA_ID=CAMNT_0026037367 /DNA_START=41 /DNA_END=1915 /DNA_ORIENTATION=-